VQKSIRYGVSLVSLSVLAACASVPADRANTSAPAASPLIRFADVTRAAGIPAEAGGKYNGPSVADIDHDGHYDLLLNNHDDFPPRLLWGQAGGTFRVAEDTFKRWDAHGIAPGDFDGDGDADVLVSVGGGNGTNPRPPILHRNDNGQMIDITPGSDIDGIGARGRAARWLDLDGDGDLDLMEFNESIPGKPDADLYPAFENLGGGRFKHRPVKGMGDGHANKVIVFDYNTDGKPDLLLYPEVKLLRGNGDFTFTDVTAQALPPAARGAAFVVGAADPDIDNDGDADLYFARGLSDLQMYDRGFIFRPEEKTINLRQAGHLGSKDGMTFQAGDTLEVGRLGHVKYIWREPVPLYLGAAKTKIVDPTEKSFSIKAEDAQGFPDDLGGQTGWYIGHIGGGQWRLQWHINERDAWTIFATFNDVEAMVSTDWTQSEYGKPDMLLRNDNGVFTDMSSLLPAQTNDANHGVTYGDFDNDGWTDLFVFRYGHLGWRRPDWLLRNNGAGTGFALIEDHGGTVTTRGGNGDNGMAFDFDNDGAVDIIAGDEDDGFWALNRNLLKPGPNSQFVHIRVGYSPRGTDPIGAVIKLEAGDLSQWRRVGSAGESFSQSVLNIAHFGLGARAKVDRVVVTWRDGTSATLRNQDANRMLVLGDFPGK